MAPRRARGASSRRPSRSASGAAAAAGAAIRAERVAATEGRLAEAADSREVGGPREVGAHEAGAPRPASERPASQGGSEEAFPEEGPGERPGEAETSRLGGGASPGSPRGAETTTDGDGGRTTEARGGLEREADASKDVARGDDGCGVKGGDEGGDEGGDGGGKGGGDGGGAEGGDEGGDEGGKGGGDEGGDGGGKGGGDGGAAEGGDGDGDGDVAGTSAEVSPLLLGSSHIRRLPPEVVNRIAAGEVIQRPSNALKELLENSLDAGSRHVTVTVAQGGVRLLRVQDDGCGVSRADLPLLCERHATSKLASAGDLAHLATFGFRGEALASMSFAAHVTVVTRRRDEGDCGYKATYRDGKLFPEPRAEPEAEPDGGDGSEGAAGGGPRGSEGGGGEGGGAGGGPRGRDRDGGGFSSLSSSSSAVNPSLVAAQPGTTVEIRDLFFAAPLRRKALKSPAAEYDAILDVVRRYAVFRPDVSFVARREGEARPDVATVGGSTREEVVRQVFGREAARGLLPVRCELGGGCVWGDDGIRGAEDEQGDGGGGAEDEQGDGGGGAEQRKGRGGGAAGPKRGTGLEGANCEQGASQSRRGEQERARAATETDEQGAGMETEKGLENAPQDAPENALGGAPVGASEGVPRNAPPLHGYSLSAPICSVRGLVSGPEREHRRTVLVAFVNGRPVEWAALRRAIEASYAAVVQKTVRPFVFLSVRVPATHVDVNVHPTKRDVGLLFVGDVTRAICAAIEDVLGRGNEKRSFTQQTIQGTGFAFNGGGGEGERGGRKSATADDPQSQRGQSSQTPDTSDFLDASREPDASQAGDASQEPGASQEADASQGPDASQEAGASQGPGASQAGGACDSADASQAGGEWTGELADASQLPTQVLGAPALDDASRDDGALASASTPSAPRPSPPPARPGPASAPRLSPSPLSPHLGGRPRPSPPLHPASKDSPVPYRPEKLVRVDARTRTLRAFLSQASPSGDAGAWAVPGAKLEVERDADARTLFHGAREAAEEGSAEADREGEDAAGAGRDGISGAVRASALAAASPSPAAAAAARLPPVPPTRPGAAKRARTGAAPSALASFFADVSGADGGFGAGEEDGPAAEGDGPGRPAASAVSLASSADPGRLEAELDREAADRIRAARDAGLEALVPPGAAPGSQRSPLPLASWRVARAPTGTAPALRSAERLLSRLRAASHPGVREALSNASLVGGLCTGQALVQSGTRLLCLAVAPLVGDLCHQRVLERVGELAALPEVLLSPPPDLEQLLRIAIADEREDDEDAGEEDDDEEEGERAARRRAEAELAAELASLLVGKAALLEDHVGIRIRVEEEKGGGAEEIEGKETTGEGKSAESVDGAKAPMDGEDGATRVDAATQVAAATHVAAAIQVAAATQVAATTQVAAATHIAATPVASTSPDIPDTGTSSSGRARALLLALPAPIPGLPVSPDRLPRLVLDLAARVPWDDEERCFEGVAAALSEFWAWGPYERRGETHEDEGEEEEKKEEVEGEKGEEKEEGEGEEGDGDEAVGERETGRREAGVEKSVEEVRLEKGAELGRRDGEEVSVAPRRDEAAPKRFRPAPEEDPRFESDRWTLEHVAIPALREGFWPPRARLADRSVFEVTRLERLYRVFERC